MRLLRNISFILLSLLALAMIIRIWPRESLLSQKESSTALFDRDDKLIRLTLTSGEIYRVFIPLDKISKELIRATLLKEDRFFYFHPGFNPVALAEAAISTLRANKRGASTITMQVARMYYHLNTKSWFGKLKQIFYAMSLELRFSKNEILEAYLNLAPYGGNIEGVGAASLIYFGKKPENLSLSEAVTLAIVPQNPSNRDLFRSTETEFNHTFQKERKRIYEVWRKHYATADFEQLEWPNIRKRHEIPFRAPHFSDMVLQQRKAATTVKTTLDLSAQSTIENLLKIYVRQKSEIGIKNGAVALLHYPTMELRALVGSADYFSKSISGQVNGYLAQRSPGSTLKPFVYGLGMDQGIIHDYSVLKDIPASYGAFDPENNDNQFTGPISVHDALIRSRNIPAVSVASQISRPDLYDFLKSSHIRLPYTKEYYGLGLALGGAEITMADLLRLYSALANDGELKKIQFDTTNHATSPSKRLLSREASRLILDILRENPRISTFINSRSSRDHFKIAWKTGTSHGFRDAWTVGVFGPYVLAVWFGNFDNKENPALVGRDLAGPFFFRVAEALYEMDAHVREFDQREIARLNIEKVEICPLSGKVRGKHCPTSSTAHFIPGVSPIHSCDVHRQIAINPVNGLRACKDDVGNSYKVFEFWPTDVMKTFAAIGLPRNFPPRFDPHCKIENRSMVGETIKISSPRFKVVYKVRVSENPTPIAFRASTDSAARKIYWYIDQSYLGSSDTKEPLFWNPRPGTFMVKAVDEIGHVAQRTITVESIL